MANLRGHRNSVFICFACLMVTLSGCLTAKKLDNFVAAQYGNELPKPNKKKKAEIEVTSLAPTGNSSISTTVHKTDKFLPLLIYWKYDHRQKCSLNPAIALVNFTNAINASASKELMEKVNGRKLELTVEQAPSNFSLVAKENMIWLIYAFSWVRVYVEPDFKDLVVSYKLAGSGQEEKTGKITVKNLEKSKDFRFFQSWKSATTEYLARYNSNFTSMTKTFVNQLASEL